MAGDGRGRVPQADRAGEGREERHGLDVAAEALRELDEERARRAHARAHLVAWLAHAERHGHREEGRVRGEAGAPRGVVLLEHEGADLGAPRLARRPAIGPDDLRHLRGDDVAVGVDGDEEGAPLQREARAPARRGDAAGAAQAEGLALEIEQLLSVDLAAAALDVLQQLALDRGHLVDLLAQALGIAELLPCGLEREGDGRVGRAAEVVRRDRAQRLEGRLGEEGAQGPRILTLPALELEEEGRGEDELDPVLDLAPEDHARGRAAARARPGATAPGAPRRPRRGGGAARGSTWRGARCRARPGCRPAPGQPETARRCACPGRRGCPCARSATAARTPAGSAG